MIRGSGDSSDQQPLEEDLQLTAVWRYHLLAAPLEAAFRRTVNLAARLLNAPIALINLLDDRTQWTKGCYGMDLREMDRSLSFCQHTLGMNGVLVVPDTTQDPRFSSLPLVTGDSAIRFYAGAPLITPDGHRVGSLCVLDTAPRIGLTEDECAFLQDLADSVVSELELRRGVAQREQQDARHAAVLTSSLDAVVIVDAHARVTDWNPEAERLFGYRRDEALAQDVRKLILTDETLKLLHRYRREGTEAVPRQRTLVTMRRRDGTVIPTEISVTPFQGDGTVYFAAFFRDLTELQVTREALDTSHALLRKVIDNVPDVIYVKNTAREYLMVNASGAELVGRPFSSILGQTDEVLLPPDTAAGMRERDETVLSSGQRGQYEVTATLPGQPTRSFRSTRTPFYDVHGNPKGLVGTITDVTEQKAAQDAIRDHNERLASEVQAAQLEILERLAHAAEYRDDDTGEHMRRVGRIAAGVARELGLPDDTVQLLERAAPMHDVGKIGISDSILLKPGRLTPEEFDIIKTHPMIGSGILSGGTSPLIKMAEEIARTHHERWYGAGYPAGLAGEAIPVSGRIVAVVDVLDALTSERPYKAAWTLDEAMEEIRRQTGRQFDREVVAALERLLSKQGQG
ncbi:HD domain-containing phosphohydrolase [Deinococcus deserti]|uniref:Putative GAF/PAS/PAC domains-containing metal dependent phosphohydrolase n=1 Tax=Deinococcus deserti (strain DSM 17065 / CIP 109153 / LMG 22923 / VCD115) TaxID=546414 RepID=C1D402_DEIDV|nr:HD domain-containing phosphohydrolase [Deinococcus deserti]ACO48231.2 putative GAF/PAS/PAC domains-containing metal dependent phosphohydrolase [Deinococcus deserti VCD115]